MDGNMELLLCNKGKKQQQQQQPLEGEQDVYKTVSEANPWSPTQDTCVKQINFFDALHCKSQQYGRTECVFT